MGVNRISPPRLAWLERESVRWRDAGIIEPEVRERILSSYEAAPFVTGPLVLVVLALLMSGVGVLLLIGYNWHRIPDAAKVGMIVAAIAAAFAGSAIAYGRERPVVGESLALLAILLYGNAIWLIAQVLHIQGYFPDAFFWFGIGSGVCAWLLRSTTIGIGTAILLITWMFASSAASQRPEYLFLAAWPAVLALAYHLRSRIAVGIAAFAMPVWAFISSVAATTGPVSFGAAAATGCALYAIGRSQREENPMKPAWQIAGLLPLLITFIPLLASGVHRGGSRGDAGIPVLPLSIVIAGVACAASFARRTLREPATAAVLLTAAGVLAWTMSLAAGVSRQSTFVLTATIAFSILALLLSVSFIRTALRSSHSYEFGFGVLFAVVFLLVRWLSVIQNMFLSGLIMLSAGAGLLFIVKLWRHRDRALALHGRFS